MAETIDEATIIAWVDGELDGAEAVRVAHIVAADPSLVALAGRHRAMKARFTAAFGPIAQVPVAVAMPMPAPAPAPVVSLAAFRAERQTKAARMLQRWWGMGGAIAASLVMGVLVGHGIGGPSGVADRSGSLALAAPIAEALDGQLSGDTGAVRVALSFKDRDGRYCRSFAGKTLSGIACRDAGKWQLRYAGAAPVPKTDYRMAGADAAPADVVATMIAGDPLDRNGEEAARKTGWR